MNTTKRWTINDIQAAVRATGSNWFHPGTMRHFGTKVVSPIYQGSGGIYFVTEDRGKDARGFTVRTFDEYTAELSTHGDSEPVPQYDTREQAVIEARSAAGADHMESAQDYQAVTILEQFWYDCRQHGNPQASTEDAARIIREAERHQFLMERSESSDDETVQTCEQRIIRLAQALGATGVRFSCDPRQCATVKLIWADGQTNTRAGDGWFVPTK